MRRIVIAGLLLGVACGGGMETDVRTRSGPTQFAGKNAVFFMYDAWVTGIAVDLADGGVNTSGPLAITALELYVQDAPWSCWLSDAGSPPADVAQVIFDMYRPKPAPFSTGDYALGGTARPDGGDWSIGIYLDWHPECLAQDSHLTGGKVTLSSLTEEEAQGWMFVSLDDARSSRAISSLGGAQQCSLRRPTGAIPRHCPGAEADRPGGVRTAQR